MNKITFYKLNKGEQVFKGSIIVERITEIIPKFQGTYTPMAQSVHMEMDESQLRELFYDIWAAVGDNLINDWMKAERKQIVDYQQ